MDAVTAALFLSFPSIPTPAITHSSVCPTMMCVLMTALSDGDASSGTGSSSDAPALISTCACTREAVSLRECVCVCVQYTHRALAIPRLLLFLFYFLADAAAAWPKRGIVPCHPPCSPLYFSSRLYAPPLSVPYLPAHPYCVRISVCVCVCKCVRVLEGTTKITFTTI